MDRLNSSFIAYVTVLLFVALPVALQGQNTEFGFSFNGGFPQGEFRDNVEDNGFGLEGFIGYNPAQSPLTVGLNVGFINYGRDRRREAFNPNIPEVSVEVETTNNIITGHFFTRLEYPDGMARPYAEGLIGLSYLFTESSVQDDRNVFEDEDIATTRNFDDTALSGGIGGGVKIKVGESARPGGGRQQWFIDIRVKYLLGGEAEYLREGSLRNNNGNLEFDTRTSSTNLLTVGIGFVVKM